MDDRRHRRAQQHRLDDIVRQLFQGAFQLAAGRTGKPFAHDMHAIEEQRKAADHIKDVEDIHILLFLFQVVL